MRIVRLIVLCPLFAFFSLAADAQTIDLEAQPPNLPSGDTVVINMAALDQPWFYNRMGATQPTGMMYALEVDIVAKNPAQPKKPGNVRLRQGKRPRPIVLRANQGDIVVINFTNYLRPFQGDEKLAIYPPFQVTQDTINPIYPATREAGVHITGMQMVNSINDDASFSGTNDNSLVGPGKSTTYTVMAGAVGNFLITSMGAPLGNGEVRGGTRADGLFGLMTVQPPGAEWYRSQVTELELFNATTHWLVDKTSGTPTQIAKPSGKTTPAARQKIYNKGGFPVVDYDAMSPVRTDIPLLRMYRLKSNRPHYRELVHSDLTAIITGPNKGEFLPEQAKTVPDFYEVCATPERLQPYREFSIMYHEAPWAVQAFPIFYDNSSNDLTNITQTLVGGVDQFAINYGTGGIGAEIYANRIGVGPMANCTDCAYEEFFLSAWAVGDPAMVVDKPANVVGEAKRLKQKINANKLLTEQMLRDATFVEGGLEQLETASSDDMVDPNDKATRAFFPDDPSNVYHSYMNDHVKFRLAHAGAGVTHVHHQHAHQWLHSPNSKDGHYLDSQTLNPGATYTLDMVYNSSGNKNKTVGDQIFHCHFYPHFAQGMWSMWRVHDVLELGTVLDRPNGKPIAGARALPDGEIVAGTPIPGLVPLPTKAMAPIPAIVKIDEGQVVVTEKDINPGYPFFIPGVAGSRAPKPPLDFAQGDYEDINGNKGTGSLNGGLPRKVAIGGNVAFENHTKYDWTKVVDVIDAIHLPEEGTYFEQAAMQAHATCDHPTLKPDGTKGTFVLNGLPPEPGAPYAAPGRELYSSTGANEDESCLAVGKLRVYKAANIQIDAVLNKQGWHYPQTRPIVLWGDVASTVAGDRPPQPFFFRANSKEVIEYWHTNLVPEYYELDDYQVRTPTDVIGQHIHLVKFDVTSSDGAANGFNYEDGTFSPEAVVDNIDAINAGKWYTPDLTKYFNKPIKEMAGTPSTTKLVPYKPNPVWGTPPSGQKWEGAQTTIQRWYADPLYGSECGSGYDRTLRTVFTHDHFGPSTHQQIGLYAGLLIEPENSVWLNSSTGDPLGVAQAADGKTREVYTEYTFTDGVPTGKDASKMSVDDGGPTDWQAIIQPDTLSDNDSAKIYREFMYEFQDNQQAYLPESRATADTYPTWRGQADSVSFADSANAYRGWIDPNYALIAPTGTGPQLVSIGNVGVLSMNYRNEPLPSRVATVSGVKSAENAQDLAYAFDSQISRDLAVLNSQPTPGYINPATGAESGFVFPKQPIGPGMEPGDPYTPLARAYNGDRVQIRTLVGAHVNPHYFNVHGVKWLFEPSFRNSGYRSNQTMSLSEHFEMNFTMPNVPGVGADKTTDYLIKTSADEPGMQSGSWGLLRSYGVDQDDLAKLPNNPDPGAAVQNCGCPATAPVRNYDVTAVSIDKYQQFGTNWGKLPYNERYRNYDSKAIVFLRTSDLNDFMHGDGYRPEPMVLRANAGECIKVILRNEITSGFNVEKGSVSFAPAATTATNPNTYNYEASQEVGLHPQLLSYDVGQYDGSHVGFNAGDQTLSQGDGTVSYEWYAGEWNQVGDTYIPQPVEFGSVLLSSPDPLEQYISGLFGAMIIEPAGSYWVEDQNAYSSYTSANVYASKADFDAGKKPMFREFVLIFQDNLFFDAEPIATNYGAQVNAGLNYRTEPLGSRVFTDATLLNSIGTVSNMILNFNPINIANITTDRVVQSEPETPIFAATKGTPVRFRLMHTGGTGDGNVFDLHGHVWQELPYQNNSTVIGYNDESQWMGTRGQLGALNTFDIMIPKAGGEFAVPGDYLYLDWRAEPLTDGVWGIFRVTDGNDASVIAKVDLATDGSMASIEGKSTVDPNTGKYPTSVSAQAGSGATTTASVNQANGNWIITGLSIAASKSVTITSTLADGSQGSSREYPATEWLAYSKQPERVFMVPFTPPAVKSFAPGINVKPSEQGRPVGRRTSGLNQ